MELQIATSAPGPRALDRRDAVWTACDELASQGVKPTLSKLRPLHRGGSDTDVQADIQSWFARLFKNHLAKGDELELPKDVAALMRQLWEAARGASDAQLRAGWESLEAEREKTEAAALADREQRDAALASVAATERALAAQTAKAEGLAEALDGAKARELRLAADVDALNERLERGAEDMSNLAGRHAREMAEAAKRHAAEVSAEREARERESALIRSESSARMDEFERQHRLAEERYRGLERNLLMEIDRARNSTDEWKRAAQSARLDSSTRENAIKAQSDAMREQAASLAGELRATAAALADARAEVSTLRSRLETMLARPSGAERGEPSDPGAGVSS